MESRTLMQRLKEDTRALHGAAEAEPYMRDLQAGTLPREVFAASLPLLREVRLCLEQSLEAHSENPAIAACFQPHHRLARFFDQDIEFFSVRPAAAPNKGVEEFKKLVADAAAQDPAILLGAFYVLEGSNLGGAVLRRKVQEAYKLKDAEGTAAMDPHGGQLYVRWRAFSAAMDGLALDGSRKDAIVETAKRAFAAIGHLYGDLYAPADPA